MTNRLEGGRENNKQEGVMKLPPCAFEYAKEVEELPQDNEEALKVLPNKPTMDKGYDSARAHK